MTNNDPPTIEDDAETTTEDSANPSITPQPPNVPPSVSISVPATVRVGVPATIVVNASRGTRWRLIEGRWEAEPAVTYTKTHLDSTDGQNRRLLGVGGGSFPLTFTQARSFMLSAFCETSTGTMVQATSRAVSVTPAVPPVFSWIAPADGAVVNLGPGGAPLTVQLTSAANEFYPWSVAIDHNGGGTSGPHSGNQYTKTITLAPAPLGPRSISVTCTDPNGLATTQTRSVIAQDSVPPTVTIDAFDDDVTVTSLPYQLILTGTTNGASSGVTGVQWAVAGGPSGSAVDTAPGAGWATWQASILLPTTGSYDFTITVTNSRGSTSSASGSINLHL